MTKNIFKATDPDFVKKYLSKKKESFFPDCNGKEILRIEIKRVSPEWAEDTCLVRYKIEFEDNIQKIVRGTAKVNYSKKDVWEMMDYLYDSLPSSSGLAIPRPLEYLDEINMLFYEEAPGTPLVFLLQKDDQEEKKRAMEKAATWLSWLHTLSPDNKKVPKALFIASAGYKETLKKMEDNLPELKDHILTKEDVDFVDDIWTAGNRIIHNDFYPGNSIVGEDIIYGIDFDRAGFGPPLMDVAALFSFFDFSEKMWLHKMNESDSQELKNVFIKEYCLINELDIDKTIEDIRPFVIKSFLDQLHYYVAFLVRGMDSMDKETRDGFSKIIRDILVKIKNLK